MTKVKSLIATSAAILAAIVAVKALAADPAAPIDYTPPEVGARVYFPRTSLTIGNVDGDILTYVWAHRTPVKSLRGVVDAPGALQYDPEAARALWPLRVGKEVRFPVDQHDGITLKTTIKVLAQERLETPAGTFDTVLIETSSSQPFNAQEYTTKFWLDTTTSLPVRIVRHDFNPANGISSKSFDVMALRVDPPRSKLPPPTTYDGSWEATQTLNHVRNGKNAEVCRKLTYSLDIKSGTIATIRVLGYTLTDPKTNDYFTAPDVIDVLWETTKGNQRIVGRFDGATLTGTGVTENCVYDVQWHRTS